MSCFSPIIKASAIIELYSMRKIFIFESFSFSKSRWKLSRVKTSYSERRCKVFNGANTDQSKSAPTCRSHRQQAELQGVLKKSPTSTNNHNSQSTHLNVEFPKCRTIVHHGKNVGSMTWKSDCEHSGKRVEVGRYPERQVCYNMRLLGRVATSTSESPKRTHLSLSLSHTTSLISHLSKITSVQMHIHSSLVEPRLTWIGDCRYT